MTITEQMMDKKHSITITTRDRVLRSWYESMELARDFRIYADDITDNDKLAEIFRKFAEDEGKHAAILLDQLKSYEK